VLSDNGVQFAALPKNRSEPTAMWRGLPFDPACQQHHIEHRLTKPHHPWTNRQVGVALLGRTLRRHLADFVAAYNFVRRFKLLKGLTPYKYVCKA
jgi:transposase InsO family protein